MPDYSPLSLATTLARRSWATIADRFRLYRVRLHGVEVTQSIQHYSAAEHLTDPADRGMDNSVQLVANKAAWVRVYVRSGLLGTVAGVRGTLAVERRRAFLVYDPVTTLSPQPPGSVTALSTATYATERGSVASTLNFVIPAASFVGTMRLTVRLTDSAGTELDTRQLTVSASLRQTLRIRAILVSYSGPATAVVPPPPAPPPPNINLAAPTLGNLATTAGLSLRAMPVQATGVFASAATRAWNLPLDDPRTGAGGCSNNWNVLLAALATDRTNDGNRGDVVYYGILPATMPVNVPGCGVGGLGGGRSGDGVTLLHEIGHGYGFQHTPCGAAGATDPSYPTYEPYASASIGEYGLDISNGNVLSPATARDYMSYCGPVWMSLYQHDRLIGNTRLDPRWIYEEPWWKDYLPVKEYVIPDLWLPDPPPYQTWQWLELRMNPVIAVTGIVRSEKDIEVRSVMRVQAAGSPQGEPTRLTAQLADESGRTLARGTVFRLRTHGSCGCDGDEPQGFPYAFQAYVPDVGRGAALAIRDGEEEVWSRRAPARAPEVRSVKAYFAGRDQLVLQWSAEATTEETEAWAQWSRDRGRTWQGLAAGLGKGEATVGTGGLPGGELLVRVLVSDGFSTAVSEPARVELPERPPDIGILHPAEGQTLLAGGTMQLWASATDAAGQPLPDEACRWLLDARDVGRGTETWLEAPPPGEHRVTLVVRGPVGEVEQTVRFTTVGGGAGPPAAH